MDDQSVIKVLSYNIHKGVASGGRRWVLREIRALLQDMDLDLVFLQEIVGKYRSVLKKEPDHSGSQFEYLADALWPEHRYGQNAAVGGGHHGNAILTRFPISSSENLNISTNRHEKRGILHTAIQSPHKNQTIHACCTHLGLTAAGRAAQLKKLITWLKTKIPANDPLILAGDFNDWLRKASVPLRTQLDVREVIESTHGRLKGTFPAILPILTLDRIYIRGFEIKEAKILRERVWRRLSDHIPVLAVLKRI